MNDPILIRQHIKHPTANITLFAQPVNKKQVQIVALEYGLNNCYKGITAKLSNNPLLKRYSRLINEYLDGKILSLDKIELLLDGYTDFQKRVLRAARSIPRGSAVSYKELAKMSGYPRAARAVANVMRHNPFPLVIPCHRVIRSDGSIGGFGGKTRGATINLKRKLLEHEGVTL